MNKLSKTLLITFVGFFSMNPSYAFDLFYIEGVLDSTNSRTIKNQVYGIDLSENSKTLLTEIVLDSFDGSAGIHYTFLNKNVFYQSKNIFFYQVLLG